MTPDRSQTGPATAPPDGGAGGPEQTGPAVAAPSLPPQAHALLVPLYALVCVATVVLWMGEDEPLPYPWPVLLCAVAAYAFTDRWERLVLPPRLAPLFGIGAIALLAAEEVRKFQIDPVIPLGHLLVSLQLIVFFHRKKRGYLWAMVFMSFLILVIAAIHNNKVTFGMLLVAYAVLAFWVIAQLVAWRQAMQCCNDGLGAERAIGRAVQEADSAAAAKVGQRPLAPFDGLLVHCAPGSSGATGCRPLAGWRGAAALASSCCGMLALGLLWFLVIPRTGNTAWTQSHLGPALHLTGFDEQVRLGELGTILESDDEVMRIYLFDEQGQAYQPTTEPLWRGVVLTNYEYGRWERYSIFRWQQSPWLAPQRWPKRHIRQEIQLQPQQGNILFGMRPALAGRTRNGAALELSPLDGILLRPGHVAPGPLQYTVISARTPDAPQPAEYTPGFVARNVAQFSMVPYDLRTQLEQYLISQRLVPPGIVRPRDMAWFRQQVRNYILSGGQSPAPPVMPRQLCQRFVFHLRDSGRFTYTLAENVVDARMDPVLDFLVNRRSGHCEYFASALALLLRTVGIPSRLINGFKGGDWSQLISKSYTVREKHAHSWVEAIVVEPASRRPHWITLDPTSAADRQQLVAMVDTTPTVIRQVRDLARQLWYTYILNYNAVEQEQVVYGPVRRLVSAPLVALANAADQLMQPGRRRVGWVAAAAVAVVVAVLVIAAWGLMALLRLLAGTPRVGRPRHGARVPDILRSLASWLAERLSLRWLARAAGPGRVPFYDRLLRLLGAEGIEKSPFHTPRQHARQAAAALAGPLRAPAVAQVPERIVERFYQVRFGRTPLDERQQQEVQGLLLSLERALVEKPWRSNSSDSGSVPG